MIRILEISILVLEAEILQFRNCTINDFGRARRVRFLKPRGSVSEIARQTGLRGRGQSRVAHPPGDDRHCAYSRLYSPITLCFPL